MIEKAAEHLGRVIKRSLPKGWCYVLVLSEHQPDGSHIVLSDVTHTDTIRMLRVKADFLERQGPGLAIPK